MRTDLEVEARKMEGLSKWSKPIVTSWLVYSHLNQIRDGFVLFDVLIDGEFAGTFSEDYTEVANALHFGEEYVSMERKRNSLKIVLVSGVKVEVCPLDLIYMHHDEAYDLMIEQISVWKGIFNTVTMEILKCTTEMQDNEWIENCKLEFREEVDISEDQQITAMVQQFIAEAYTGDHTPLYIPAEISREGIALDGAENGDSWKRYRIYPSKS
ncbi:hypothetical protein [Alicyclobacillus acidiphilus]|uniref:hypothetical protein n=1 Tax=Alicyclobacillus acidiphilus TaxID=182455 RepID=UPI0008302711|nr:hypothetical protein [Alicyclobacillus acidiphilus]